MTKRVVDVLLPVALDRAYSYRVPEELELAPGDIVCVPLGAREATAVVWADNPKPNPRLDNRLKDVEQKLELPPLRPELRSFVDWVANYTVSSRGMVLRMCLRMGEHLGAERERVGVRLAGAPPQRMTPARQRVLALFADGMVRGKSEAAREAGVSVGVIDGLIDEGTLEVLVLPPEPVAQKPDPDFVQSEFTPDQSAAATALKATVAKGGYSVTLLDGVTGSGKTEVYFEAVADTIRSGRQSLILMPEIALTAQFLDRFSARFGVRPAEWHSELSPRKRAATWRWCAAISRAFPSCCRRRRRRWKRSSMRGAGAIRNWHCPSASAASLSRRSRRSICARRRRRAAVSFRRCSPARWRSPSSAASRRCCSSIAAATRR
jgi:primosomal protein N' (replication factor Y)